MWWQHLCHQGRGLEGHWLEPPLSSVAPGLQQVWGPGFPSSLFWLFWMGTAASETVPAWRGKLEGESNPPSWVESWLKTTGNENREGGTSGSSSCTTSDGRRAAAASGRQRLWLRSSSEQPHRWNRSCPGHQPPPAPAPGVPPVLGEPGGEPGLCCPVRAAPGPPRPAAFDAGEWQVHCGLFVPPSVLQVCTKPAMETRASRCPRKPAGAIRKCK